MPYTYYNELFYDNGSLGYAGMGYDQNGTFLFHGSGRRYRENGTLLYEGDWRDGEWHGKGKAYYEDGSLLYEGDWRDGKWHGKGKFYGEDGTLIYEGDYQDDNRHGKGKAYDEDGSLWYEGDWQDGELHGKGKLYGEDGTLLYEGDFRGNQRHGRGKAYNEDGSLFEGEFQDDEPVAKDFSSRAQQPRDLSACLNELNTMIGLSEVKAQVHSLVNLIRLQKERRDRGLPVMTMSYHLVFTGNPGTGKTTVARLLAEIYANLGVVSKGNFVEVDRSGLVAGYLGQTALKTEQVIDSARGGVLFIDEAYSLAQKEKDQYGMEAIDCLMKRMEDYRDDFVVIVAGYQAPMERFLESNPGLKSRFSRYIHFENYEMEDLLEILKRFCKSNGYQLETECLPLFEKQMKKRMEDPSFKHNFSNGRYVRNIFEKMVVAQGNRLATTDISQLDNNTLTLLTTQDLQYVISNHEFEKTS